MPTPTIRDYANAQQIDSDWGAKYIDQIKHRLVT